MERSLPSERCGDAARLCELLARIEALAVVNGSAIIQEQYNNGAGRIIVNLWCRANHNVSSDKQPYVNLNKKPASDPTAVPTYEVAAAKLLSLLETKHAGCLAAAEQAKAAATKRQQGLCAPRMHMSTRFSRPHLVPCSRAAACSRTYPYRRCIAKECARVCLSAALSDDLLCVRVLAVIQATRLPAAHQAAGSQEGHCPQRTTSGHAH